MVEGEGKAVLLRVRRDDRLEAPSQLDILHDRVLACSGDVSAAIALAAELGHSSPRPGTGRTIELWERFATMGAADASVARIVEPHLDAVAILDESGERTPMHRADAVWGVFAAEGAGVRVDAVSEADRWVLTGRKPWCSLAGELSHALITAHTPEGRRLFALELRHPAVRVDPAPWQALGLSSVPSGPIDLDGAPAVPVGVAGWYLERTGFAWGGLGVAAIWWGVATAIGRAVRDSATAREPDQIALMHLGATDAALWGARTALVEAARAVDDGGLSRAEAGLLALRTRAVVADACERVIRHAAHGLGPAPLALDRRHATRVADLELYLRQHHAERDDAASGSAILGGAGDRW